MRSVAVVGPGRMGLALADALRRSEELLEVTIFGRRAEPPPHPIFSASDVRYVYGLEPLAVHCMAVLLAVPDAAVPEVAHHVAAQGPAPEGCSAFHLSGALPTDVLAPFHAAGYQVGVFHPWVLAPSTPLGPDRFRGAAVGVTASPDATRTAAELASLIGADLVTIPAARRAAADAAVTGASMAVPVLIETMAPLLEQAGVPADEAVAALVPLLRSVLAEVEEHGPDHALSAVMAGVDPEASGVHLRALEGEERRLYEWLWVIAGRRLHGREAEPTPALEHVSRE
jgi:predicted short-subunit dehydrogenase-like oxidoreductase (DUF2520 family)